MPCANCNLAGPLRAQVFYYHKYSSASRSLPADNVAQFWIPTSLFQKPENETAKVRFHCNCRLWWKKTTFLSIELPATHCLLWRTQGLGDTVTMQFKWMIVPGTWIIRKYSVIFHSVWLCHNRKKENLLRGLWFSIHEHSTLPTSGMSFSPL